MPRKQKEWGKGPTATQKTKGPSLDINRSNPKTAKPKVGENCVADDEFMRRESVQG